MILSPLGLIVKKIKGPEGPLLGKHPKNGGSSLGRDLFRGSGLDHIFLLQIFDNFLNQITRNPQISSNLINGENFKSIGAIDDFVSNESRLLNSLVRSLFPLLLLGRSLYRSTVFDNLRYEFFHTSLANTVVLCEIIDQVGDDGVHGVLRLVRGLCCVDEYRLSKSIVDVNDYFEFFQK